MAVAGKRVFTKTQESAISVRELKDEIRALAGCGMKSIFITGFLTTSCVKQTALDLRRILPKPLEIAVVENLCGCRGSKYAATGRQEDSPYQQTRRALISAGVRMVSDLPAE